MALTYTYPKCTMVRVIDGDTVVVVIDVGLEMSKRETVRLAGLNAPEADTPAGQAAASAVRAWFAEESSTVTIRTHKPDPRDKFGRYLAEIVSRSGRCLNDDLVAAGHAVRWTGRGARPTP